MAFFTAIVAEADPNCPIDSGPQVYLRNHHTSETEGDIHPVQFIRFPTADDVREHPALKGHVYVKDGEKDPVWWLISKSKHRGK